MSQYMIACTSWLEDMASLSASERGRLFTALLMEARGEMEEPRGTERLLFHKFVQDAHDAQYILNKSKDTLSQVSTENSSNLSTSLEDRFERFWNAWPSKYKVNRKRCFELWTRMKPSDALVDEMIDSINAWKRSRQWQQGYVPNPDTWLRGEKWTDAKPDPWNGDTQKNAALRYKQSMISQDDFDQMTVNLDELRID